MYRVLSSNGLLLFRALVLRLDFVNICVFFFFPQVTATMKVEELVDLAKEKKKLPGEWVLHECVCDGTLGK